MYVLYMMYNIGCMLIILANLKNYYTTYYLAEICEKYFSSVVKEIIF